MSGVGVIRYLLANHAPLTAQVPVTRIRAGVLPIGTAMPAIAVTMVSSTRRNTAGMREIKTMVTERVQVSLMVERSQQGGSDYPSLVSISRLVRQACPQQTGTISGIEVISVLPDIEGPDIEDVGIGMMVRSQDFIVRWREAR